MSVLHSRALLYEPMQGGFFIVNSLYRRGKLWVLNFQLLPNHFLLSLKGPNYRISW